MNRRNLLLVLLLAAVVAAPSLAGGKCTADTQTCLNKMASTIKQRGWVGVELDHNDHGRYVVTFVEQDSPAMEAGMQEGDVLVALNGIEINDQNQEKLAAAKKAMRVGKSVTYTIERAGCCHKAGGVKEVNVTLAEIPEPVLAKWIGGHMLEHAVIEVAQY
jgi:C-terminal processing protease CtpA/Prc